MRIFYFSPHTAPHRGAPPRHAPLLLATLRNSAPRFATLHVVPRLIAPQRDDFTMLDSAFFSTPPAQSGASHCYATHRATALHIATPRDGFTIVDFRFQHRAASPRVVTHLSAPRRNAALLSASKRVSAHRIASPRDDFAMGNYRSHPASPRVSSHRSAPLRNATPFNPVERNTENAHIYQ